VNLPNKITLARIFLVPLIMFFLLINFEFGQITIVGQTLTYSEIIAAIIFIIAASTDGIDGYIARKRKLVTNLGKFLDPLADKLLVTAALISLVEMDRLAAWIVIIIISREFAVTGLRLVASAEGNVISASNLGKFKTISQIIAIILLMLNNFPFSYFHIPLDQVFIYIAVIMTVLSGIDYFVKNLHIINIIKSSKN